MAMVSAVDGDPEKAEQNKSATGNRLNRCMTYLIARSPSISSRVSSAAAAERFPRAAAICPREQMIAFVLSQTDL